MNTNLPLRIKAGRMPLNFSGKPQSFLTQLVRRMKLQVSGMDVILGQTGGTEPASDRGLWVDATETLYLWDRANGRYSPQAIQFSSNGFISTVGVQDLTEDRAITFPDKEWTIGAPDFVALLLDVYAPRDPQLIPTDAGDFFNLNAKNHESYYGQLHSDVTVVITGFPDGKRITLGIINDGTSFTVTWPAGIRWGGGADPTQPVATDSGSGIGIYELRSINGLLYGTMRDATPAAPTMEATTVDPMQNYGGSGNTGGSDNITHQQKLP